MEFQSYFGVPRNKKALTSKNVKALVYGTSDWIRTSDPMLIC